MNGNINMLILRIGNEVDEIKGLISDYRIKQKADSIKQKIKELEKTIKMKENYYNQFIGEKKINE